MPADRDLPETDTQYEQDLSAAMARAGETFHTEPLPLVDTGWSYGRRLRRRRRASVLAGAAALALVGVGGVALAGLPGGGTGRVAAAGAPSAGATAAPVSGQEFLDLFTPLLPAGNIVKVEEARGTESGTPQLRLTHDDGHGLAYYLFWITGPSVMPDDAKGCAYADGLDVCTSATTTDGSQLVVYQAGTRDGEPDGSKTWSASLYSKSGYHLMLQEWNRNPLEPGSGITRVDPPMTTGRIAEVAADERWKTVAAAIPEHPVMPQPTGADGGLATVRPMSPSDLASLRAAATGPGKEGAVPAPSLPSTEGALSGPLTLPAFPPPGP
ncbi:hypothetical protein SAMN05216371_3060 [Streptomyces sp. TLI_053]|uniref:hypothetical protein n=1 Tax=Streptomyces sp. TLI_053 TaxID=1855352 RepID=UPI0008799E08|nr:hypothetical protein [Streptomyces sp. TLI_053]SDT59784.1 hypothetical protein SAMN05216371_3060 [Streptomyces sp. TLI_053]